MGVAQYALQRIHGKNGMRESGKIYYLCQDKNVKVMQKNHRAYLKQKRKYTRYIYVRKRIFHMEIYKVKSFVKHAIRLFASVIVYYLKEGR